MFGTVPARLEDERDAHLRASLYEQRCALKSVIEMMGNLKRWLHIPINTHALAPCDSGLIGGLFDIAGDRFGDALVEDGGDDVVGVEFVFFDDRGDGVGGGDLHLFVDARRSTPKCAAKDARSEERRV